MLRSRYFSACSFQSIKAILSFNSSKLKMYLVLSICSLHLRARALSLRCASEKMPLRRRVKLQTESKPQPFTPYPQLRASKCYHVERDAPQAVLPTEKQKRTTNSVPGVTFRALTPALTPPTSTKQKRDENGHMKPRGRLCRQLGTPGGGVVNFTCGH